jgi:photosystem II stability/assembly factor-like uncharacterized protein
VRRVIHVAAAVIAGMAIATPALAEVPGVWSGGGPPAGVVSSLVVDPVDPRIVYGGGFTSIYRTEDGAASWQTLPLPREVSGGVGAMAVDPAVPATLYLHSGIELFRSSDSARTWKILSNIGFVSAFALLPGEPAGLLVATFETGLQRSADGGETWEPSSEGLPEPNSIFGLAVAPSDGDVVYALGGESLFRSADGGRSWTAASPPPELGFVSSLAVDPSDPQTIYTAGSHSVFRSTDGGITWKELRKGLAVADEGFIASLLAAGGRPTTLYVLTDRALFRSADAGDTWSLVNDDELNRLAPWAIAVDPTDPAHLYRSTGLGVFVSTDGGVTFAPASTGLPGLATQVVAAGPGATVHAGLFLGGVATSTDGGGSWRPGTGADIEFESLMAIAAEPVGGRVYAGSYTGRFFRSDDGGSTWDSMGFRLPHATIWGLAPDPGKPGRVLAATELGVYRSGTAGEAWRRSSRGLPNTGVRVVAFAGSAPSVVYAGLDRRGVFRSSDGGRSWRPAGLPGSTVLSLAVDPRQPSVVYAATRSGGAYRSDNGGRTWKRLAATGLTASVVLDPAAPDTVLLAMDGRVLRSTNRGAGLVSYKEGLPHRGGSPVDPEASAPLTVVGLAAVPGGAYAATWSGVFGVEFE